jgi:7-cyano-7-deazaguanine synthase
MSEILLFSAGLDSFPAWHRLGKPPALYFDIRHHFRDQELASVEALATRHQMDLTISDELDLSAWDTPQGDLIPFRNVLLAMLAALRADVIWCVGVKGDHTADKSPEAFARMSTDRVRWAPGPGRQPVLADDQDRGCRLVHPGGATG